MRRIHCPKCGHGVLLLDESPDQPVSCPGCGEHLLGPAPTAVRRDRPSPSAAAALPDIRRPAPDNTAVVMTFWSPEEANLARLHLEAHGIPAFIEGDTTAGTLFGGLAQVKLLVAEEDVARAHRALDEAVVAATSTSAFAGEHQEGIQDRPTPPEEAGDDPAAGEMTAARSLGRPLVALLLIFFFGALGAMLVLMLFTALGNLFD